MCVRDLAFEMHVAFEQFSRYGSAPDDERIVDVISLLTDLNDDIAHGRSVDGMREHCKEITKILDDICSSYDEA